MSNKSLQSWFVGGVAAVAVAAFAAVGAAEAAPRAETSEVEGLSGPAVMAIVSLVDQRVSFYDAYGGVIQSRVSSGRTAYETPVGVYSILQKKRDHTSNLYEDAAMPFMQRITWSGVALHAGKLPGHPASAGCVRMPYKFASDVFERTKLGMRVVVARRDVAPIAFTHPLLPKPYYSEAEAVLTRTALDPEADESSKASAFEPDLSNWPDRQALLGSLRAAAEVKEAEAKAAAEPVEDLQGAVKARAGEEKKAMAAQKSAERAKARAEAQVSRAERRLDAATQPRTIAAREDALAKAQNALDAVQEKVAEATAAAEAAAAAHAEAKDRLASAEAAKAAAEAEAKFARRKTLPISVFVSLKEQRLYVRQGHEAVMDVAVDIANPETPIGTYVYQAVDYTEGGDDVTWMAVSIGPHVAGQEGYGKKKAPTPTEAAGARAALDRVTIPAEVNARISEALWPGSSIIVSDEGISKETGEATDFVVLISGEPQGGIVIRPREQRQPQQTLPEYFVDYDDRYYYDEYGRRYDRRRYDRRYERRYGRYDDRYERYDRRRERRRREPRGIFGLW